MTQASPEGTIASVDARLRPDGEKGPLVAPLRAYESYYRDRAHLWEIHALTRARPISGPLCDSYIAIAQDIWRTVKQPDLFAKIDNMLDRIQRERGSGNDFLDFKTGIGGMIEAEFLVQALQMRTGIWESNWEKALSALQKQEVVTDADSAKLIRSYRLLRRIETALRRFENKNVSVLPSVADERQKLVKRLDYREVDLFEKDYLAAREIIHDLYQRRVKAN